jgi:hypothetical protein
MKVPKDLGMFVLAAWLVLFGVLTAPFLKVSFAHSGDVLASISTVGFLVLESMPVSSETSCFKGFPRIHC